MPRQPDLRFDVSVSVALAELLRAAPRSAGYEYPVLLSADRALLLGSADSWFRPSLHAWTSHLAHIVPVASLFEQPENRPVWKTVFIPNTSACPLDSLSSLGWQCKFVLHHLLLNGVVVFVEFVDNHDDLNHQFTQATGHSPDAVVVRDGCIVDQPTLYARSRSLVSVERCREGAGNSVTRAYDYLFERLRRRRRLYYDASTFDSSRFPRYWDVLRRFIYRLQAERCAICWQQELLSELHLDHLIPRREGGAHTLINLRLIHRGANCSKGAWFPEGGHDFARLAFVEHFRNAWITPSYLRTLTALQSFTGDRVERAVRSHQRQSQSLLDLKVYHA